MTGIRDDAGDGRGPVPGGPVPGGPMPGGPVPGWPAPGGPVPGWPSAAGAAVAPPVGGGDATAIESLPADAAIRVERASRWYGSVVAVNDMTFAVGPGITGLLGPNGAGKSTLLGMMAGLLRPSSGRVAVLGRDAWRTPEVYRRVGIVPEREAVPAYLTGRAFAHYSAQLHGLPDPAAAAARAISTVDLDAAADRPIGTYSKGMRQRAKLAAALVHDPPVLLLDEPFNGMDPRQRLHVMALLRAMAAEGRTILFSSHILEEVERLAERVLVVYAGRLAASGDFREIRRLMTDRPHAFTIRSSDDRRLAAALVAQPMVDGVELSAGTLAVRVSDYAAFVRLVPRVARDAAVSLFELHPADESLERVFSYLVRR